jgi:ABC-2 type transport system ATP-binding protein
MDKIAINITNLVKSYNSNNKDGTPKLAINSLNLQVKEGSIFGLLGPNGAGKSSLINIIAGTVVKNSGNIEIMGVDIDKTPKKARSLIGIVPQEIVIDSFFPLYQSLEFTAGYFGIRPEHRRTDEILKALSLYDKRNNLPKELSGGMKRRFLVAKAMVHSPKVLILDEPTAGVDIDLRKQLWDYVLELNKQGITIIITTHYLQEAKKLCDEIAFINYGKIVHQDSKNNLLNKLGKSYLIVEFDHNLGDLNLNFAISNKYEVFDENKIRFEVIKDKNNFNKLLEYISSTGLSIKNLQVIEPDLEDIFYQLVKK